MSDVLCPACGTPMVPESTAVRIVAAGSVTGSSPGLHGWSCPRCQDDLDHLYALFYGTRDGLGFCGCGSPEDAYELVRDLLALAPFYQGWETGRANHVKVRELLGGSDGVFYLVLYMLDRAALIEHGSGIGGAWLSTKGKHYLPLIQAHEWDDFEEAGFPHDGDECPADCRHWVGSHDEWQRERILAERAVQAPDPREPIPSDDPRCRCSRKPAKGGRVAAVTGHPTEGDTGTEWRLWLDLGCPHHGGIVRELQKAGQ